MKEANLDMLFQQLLPNFAHLITIQEQTKEEFVTSVKNHYGMTNPKIKLFCMSTERSDFDTIKLDRNRQSVLFNQ